VIIVTFILLFVHSSGSLRWLLRVSEPLAEGDRESVQGQWAQVDLERETGSSWYVQGEKWEKNNSSFFYFAFILCPFSSLCLLLFPWIEWWLMNTLMSCGPSISFLC